MINTESCPAPRHAAGRSDPGMSDGFSSTVSATSLTPIKENDDHVGK